MIALKKNTTIFGESVTKVLQNNTKQCIVLPTKIFEKIPSVTIIITNTSTKSLLPNHYINWGQQSLFYQTNIQNRPFHFTGPMIEFKGYRIFRWSVCYKIYSICIHFFFCIDGVEALQTVNYECLRNKSGVSSNKIKALRIFYL